MSINGLDSLKRHQKCMRLTTNALTRAAMARAKTKTKAKRAEVKAAAANVARVACAVTVGARRKKKSVRGASKISKRDFQRQQEAELRALRSQSLPEERFNPEVF